MCGIAGFCLSPRDHYPSLAKIAGAMLCNIQERGTDATGMAWASSRAKKAWLVKRPVSATVFTRGFHHKQIDRTGAGAAILHTRYATQGPKENPANNHPIVHRNVIGVHNGHLNNDDEIFESLGGDRIGQVDSEAAFALLSRGEGTPTELLPQLRGRAALAWFNRRDRVNGQRGMVLHLARVDGSPLAIAQTKGGSLFFASTMGLLDRSLDQAGIDPVWRMDVEEGTYLRVRGGVIETMEKFIVPKPQRVTSIESWRRRDSAFTVPRRPVEASDEWPSRWFNHDGVWLDDDVFVPFSD